jgi:hypothetical protein
MAATILAFNPLDSIPFDSDMAIIFEIEDPMLMPQTRLETLATACSNEYPIIAAYLLGILDQRLFGVR